MTERPPLADANQGGDGLHHSNYGRRVYLIPWIIFLTLVLTRSAAAVTPNNPPILISEPISTRAIALESVDFTREPFAPYANRGGRTIERTRVMVFAMNLTLQSGEDLSLVAADAEDAAHHHYPLTVEAFRPVPSYEWMSAVVFKLNDDLSEVGDVLVSVSYRGVVSNRVRIGIGHVGGGLADDPDSVPTPAPPYAISGQLTDDTGHGLGGVEIALSGAETAMAISDAGGFYSFSVMRVGDYTLTPAATPYYSFTAQAFSNVHLSRTANFAGTLRNYTVSGWLTVGAGPASFLEVPVTGSKNTSFTTDGEGRYSISLPAGGNYTITPAARYYAFSPRSDILTDLTSDQINQIFIGTRQAYAISGRLIDENGNGLAGTTVHLTGISLNGPWMSVTDQNGHYNFASLPAAADFEITPETTALYKFTPHTFVDLSSDLSFDFTGLRRLTLSGFVRDQAGHGILGVLMSLAGSESATAITSVDGSYSLPATATGNYNVAPSIGQGWYNFAPASVQFNNLAESHSTDFTGTLKSIPDPASALEFDGSPKTVDYGSFWEPGVDLGHFYWEFWAMPGSNAAATYLLSDGYGGAHALLFGVASLNSSEPNRYELLGNIFDGVKFDHYFGGDQGPAAGEWGHFAVGWDGQNIITYYDGVPVGKTPFAGPRRTPGPGGGGGRLLIGGSDHSNFEGRISQVRGYEGSNPRVGLPGGVEASFAPETVFGLEGNLLSYYFRSEGVNVADLSHGYTGISHGGLARGTSAGILYDCGACPPPRFVVDPSAPNFATNTPGPPVAVPTPPPVPGDAVVFDSFSRANSTYLFGSRGGLGATEGGSAGTQQWRTNQAVDGPQPFGILNSIAVLLANTAAIAWVPTGDATANLEVRVERRQGRWGRGVHTGLSFRVLDANNYFFTYTSDSGGTSATQAVNVGYYLNGERTDLATGLVMPSAWTTLSIVTTAAGTLAVYADDTLVYSTTKPLLATATGAGLYNNGPGLALVNRWDNFTVYHAQ